MSLPLGPSWLMADPGRRELDNHNLAHATTRGLDLLMPRAMCSLSEDIHGVEQQEYIPT